MVGNLVVPDGDIQRLRRASDPLLAKVARKEVEYKFHVLDSDEVNAFSLPGGYIYVSRGLFQLVGESVEPEQDYALQFALGHEIAHVDLKHALNLVAAGRAAAKAQGVDTLSQLMVPIGLGYPDALEFAADTWAYQRMTTQLDRTRREALMFLIKLQGFSERNGFRNGRAVPEVESGLTLVDNHYRAHPAAWDRLDRLRRGAFDRQRAGLRRDERGDGPPAQQHRSERARHRQRSCPIGLGREIRLGQVADRPAGARNARGCVQKQPLEHPARRVQPRHLPRPIGQTKPGSALAAHPPEEESQERNQRPGHRRPRDGRRDDQPEREPRART
ncbi:M48 family metallopeptidase [Singulisphaera sp. Ch08]|uniref:M48 family metallopeptidase n=1 Tax=Singulisphaera sp. Ch08 TaxID=3120278 RepID=A0AAU7CT83_9BACT